MKFSELKKVVSEEGEGAASAVPTNVSGPDVSTVVGNYGTCHEIRQQLESLQKWVREQEKIINKG